MTGRVRWRTVAATLALLAVCGAPALGGNCGLCHGKQAKEFEDSAHKTRHLACTECHGGDAAMDPSTLTGERRAAACADHPSFRGEIRATDLTDLCGGCHADATRMRAYRIATDQLVLYKNSHHGRALYEKGDGNTATCVSCHGLHRILPVRDPRSPAHRWNVPATCGSCHAKADLMASYGLSTEPSRAYPEDVHGRGLLEQKLRGVPSCADCHGSHGAAPPGVGEVEDVCGDCHTSSQRAFGRGPHQQAVDEGAMQACTTCHKPHGTEFPSADWFLSEQRGGCLDCHDAGDEGGKAAREMHDAVMRLREMVDETRETLREARESGLFVEHESGYLDEARRILAGIPPETHAVSRRTIEEFIKRAEGVVQETRESVAAKRKIWRDRRILASLAAGGLVLAVLFCLGFVRIHRTFRRGG